MNALVINCSPVKNGATAEIVQTVSQFGLMYPGSLKLSLTDIRLGAIHMNLIRPFLQGRRVTLSFSEQVPT